MSQFRSDKGGRVKIGKTTLYRCTCTPGHGSGWQWDLPKYVRSFNQKIPNKKIMVIIYNGTIKDYNCTGLSPQNCTDPYDEFGPPDGIEYIFVPLGVMIFVIVLSAVVIFISRKRKLERLRHRLLPLYSFDPGEGGDDWETELLEEGFNTQKIRVSTTPIAP